VIDKISHLSSVSRGSLAATYYALRKPGHHVKVLNADGTLSDEYRTFFEAYRTDLSQDFESTLIRRQLLSFRWLNSALAAYTLAEILGERLYGRTRFQDISVSAREKAGDSPALIINTTLYNNGRRLAITSLPSEAFNYDFFADLELSGPEDDQRDQSAPLGRQVGGGHERPAAGLQGRGNAARDSRGGQGRIAEIPTHRERILEFLNRP
jgi:hypothetical protein